MNSTFSSIRKVQVTLFKNSEEGEICIYRASKEVFQVEVSLYPGQVSRGGNEVVNLFLGKGSPDEGQTRMEMPGCVLETWSGLIALLQREHGGDHCCKLGLDQIAEGPKSLEK